MINKYGLSPHPFAAQLFGHAGIEHMEKYGMLKKTLRLIGSYIHVWEPIGIYLRTTVNAGMYKI